MFSAQGAGARAVRTRGAPLCVLPPADYSAVIGSQANPNGVEPVGSTSAKVYNTHRACSTGRYHVEARSTSGLTMWLSANWGDAHGTPVPTTRTDCEAAAVEASFHGMTRARWTLIGSASARGSWDGTCSVPVVAHLVSDSTWSRVRVVARATRVVQGFPCSQTVTGTLDNLEW